MNPYVAARLCRLLEEHRYCVAEVEAVSNDGGRQGAPVSARRAVTIADSSPLVLCSTLMAATVASSTSAAEA